MFRWTKKYIRNGSLPYRVFEKVLAKFGQIGSNKICNICGWHGLFLLPMITDTYIRYNAICPNCRSFERHRALYRFYSNYFQSKAKSLLHISPEQCLSRFLSSRASNYRVSQYGDPRTLNIDLLNISPGSIDFDVILMNHVLSCTADGKKAIENLYAHSLPEVVLLLNEPLADGPTIEYMRMLDTGSYRTYGMQDIAKQVSPFKIKKLTNIYDDLFTPEEKKLFSLGSGDCVLELVK